MTGRSARDGDRRNPSTAPQVAQVRAHDDELSTGAQNCVQLLEQGPECGFIWKVLEEVGRERHIHDVPPEF